MTRTLILKATLVLLVQSATILGLVLIPSSSDGTEDGHKVGLALKIAHAEIQKENTLNEHMYRKGVDERKGGHDFNHKHMFGMFRFFKKSSFSDSNKGAKVLIRATQELTRMFGKTTEDLKLHPSLHSIWHVKTASYCKPRTPVCSKSMYRTADGSCNNLHHPTWGMSHRAQNRYLYPEYDDGVSVPRMRSVTGGMLPSARVLSNYVHGTGVCDLVEPKNSAMLMQWGQLVGHDIADTPTLKGFKGATMTCCNLQGHLLEKRPACFPIAIPANDKHFYTSCMNFVRSIPATDDNCELGVRNQVNQASSYVDASFIYGPDDENMNKLRAHKGGFLKMTELGLFGADEDQDKCVREKPGDYCMKSGDPRVHVVPGLASTQILFLREHNHIAAILGKINPHWDDEIIFQEARKVVIAINQHITYMEYLPLVVGHAHMEAYSLYSSPMGYATVYNPKADATMANAFGVAAFRFGHSQVPGDVALINNHQQRAVLKVEETFNRPTTLLLKYGKGTDEVNKWLYKDRSARSDRFLEAGVRNKLFLDKKGQSFDLAALNIQRGRDHGIPGYNAYRKWCGLPVAFHFGSGHGGLVDHGKESNLLLGKVYSHPDDIDLYAGGLSERHVVGGSVGPTFACIIARQFQSLKNGDRFWYENEFHGTGFTKDQLTQIKRIHLSRILCNNMDTAQIPRNAFQVPSIRNPYVNCEELPYIDFSYWKDLKQFGPYHPPTSPIYSTVLPPPDFVLTNY